MFQNLWRNLDIGNDYVDVYLFCQSWGTCTKYHSNLLEVKSAEQSNFEDPTERRECRWSSSLDR